MIKKETFKYAMIYNPGMSELIILCNPGNAYAGLDELAAARAYTDAALGTYESMADFSQGGGDSDHVRTIGSKAARHLILSLYATEKVTRMGHARGNFQTSSYLFNPLPKDPRVKDQGLSVPDLDVVTMWAEADRLAAAMQVQAFYKNLCWHVAIVDSDGLPRERD